MRYCNRGKHLPHTRGKECRSQIPYMVNIQVRLRLKTAYCPGTARVLPGYWEGDFIKGSSNKSSVGALVERYSRLVLPPSQDGGCYRRLGLSGQAQFRGRAHAPELELHLSFETASYNSSTKLRSLSRDRATAMPSSMQ